MNPQGQGVDLIAAHMAERMRQLEQPMPVHGTYTICRFPDFLVGIDDGIRLPQLASFGPCHSGNEHLLPFDVRKYEFLRKFLSRTESLGGDLQFYLRILTELKEDIKRCYSERIAMPADDGDLVGMMLLDGSFMVELFRGYKPNDDSWSRLVQTLIADLLKLENQLPFFVLEKLFQYNNNIIKECQPPDTLRKLALRFLYQAFRNPSGMVMVNSQIPEPKHLLDLFHWSLLPLANPDGPDPREGNHYPLMHSIQSVKYLRIAGITVRQKTAKSLLEIDFRKYQIPPLALKIPPVAVDNFTNAILANCVALEQCFADQSKHFTAYVCFMSCLMKQPEDVGYLRSVDIIQGISQDECFINMLNSIGRNVSSTMRDCYLWKQFREIHGYYNSYWAWIRRTLLEYNNIMLYCSLLQVAVGIISWRLSG